MENPTIYGSKIGINMAIMNAGQLIEEEFAPKGDVP
jgi:hypothetical protein